MFTQTDLSKMRADAARMLPETISVYSVAQTANDAGFVSDTRTLLGTYKGRIDPDVSSNTGVVAQQEQTANWYLITLEWEAPLESNYQYELNSKTYRLLEWHGEQSWKVVKVARGVLIQ